MDNQNASDNTSDTNTQDWTTRELNQGEEAYLFSYFGKFMEENSMARGVEASIKYEHVKMIVQRWLERWRVTVLVTKETPEFPVGMIIWRKRPDTDSLDLAWAHIRPGMRGYGGFKFLLSSIGFDDNSGPHRAVFMNPKNWAILRKKYNDIRYNIEKIRFVPFMCWDMMFDRTNQDHKEVF